VSIPNWARGSMAFCIREGIISSDEFDLLPGESVSRAEISEMLYIMLGLAKLI